MVLPCSLIWDIFLCLILSYSVCLCVLGSQMSSLLEGNGLTKKRCYNALQCICPIPQNMVLHGLSHVCYMCPAVVSCPLSPLVQSYTESPFACCELVPGHGGAHGFNKVYSDACKMRSAVTPRTWVTLGSSRNYANLPQHTILSRCTSSFYMACHCCCCHCHKDKSPI